MVVLTLDLVVLGMVYTTPHAFYISPVLQSLITERQINGLCSYFRNPRIFPTFNQTHAS